MQQQWSVRFADSVMERHPLLTGKWSYDYGVVFKGLQAVYQNTGEQKYFDYIHQSLLTFVNPDGTIEGYRKEEYNIDHINNGKLFYFLYHKTKDSRFVKAAQLLFSQLEHHPRTSDGVFWHKQIYPHQIWLDGLYMGAPFYAEYCKENNLDRIQDILQQFVLCEKHTRDAAFGLLHHAYDESKSMFWADPVSGLSKNFWGRSIGWFAMALCDTLEYIPEDDNASKTLQQILCRTLDGLLRHQHSSGCWFQVPNMPGRAGNYLEASVSCMAAYALAKGIEKGWLSPSRYFQPMVRAFHGILNEFVLETREGLVNLNKTCQVAGLGGPDKRDGSYAYYISEPIICNDLKGVGACIKAFACYERL